MRVRAVITAGGTAEPVDDVRVLSNRSTGRFGAALATALAHRGADVVVVGARHAPGLQGLPPNVAVVPFETTDELAAALEQVLTVPTDLVLMAAAVSDYRPRATAGKIRSDADALTLELTRTPKLLGRLRRWAGPDARLVGFKLLSGVSTDELVDTARRQLQTHDLAAVVANDLAGLRDGRHPVHLVTAADAVPIGGTRETVASGVVDALLDLPPPPATPWPHLPGPVHGAARCWYRLPRTQGRLSGTLPDASGIEGALARRRTVPWQPLAFSDADDAVWLGTTPLAAARLARAHHDLAPRLGGDAVPLLDEGRVVAWLDREPDGAWGVHPTGEGDDDVWPMTLLPQVATSARWRVDAGAEAWAGRGFSVHPRDDGRLDLVAPWDRADPTPAASTCLVDVARRDVLVGWRRTAPARGRLAFPGGKPEAGESAVAAARRELREETGLGAPGRPPWFVQQVWRGQAPTWALQCAVWRVTDRAEPVASPEFAASWMSLETAVRHPDALPGVRAVLAEVRRRLDAW